MVHRQRSPFTHRRSSNAATALINVLHTTAASVQHIYVLKIKVWFLSQKQHFVQSGTE